MLKEILTKLGVGADSQKPANDEKINTSPILMQGARINRKLISILTAIIGMVILVSLVQGLSSPGDANRRVKNEKQKVSAEKIPGSIYTLPSTYGGSGAESAALLNQPVRNESEAVRKARAESNLDALKEEEKANRSGLILLQGSGAVDYTPTKGETITERASKVLGAKNIAADILQNNQLAKADFINQKRATGKSIIKPPTSPYELHAGSIVPAALITGINSDLPGQIVAQVRENVYDSVTGNHLLIPIGSKIIGEYDSIISFGQNRVLLVWDNIIFPNGNSVPVSGMQGVDLTGKAGIKDEVDHHYWRLASGVILSSILSIGVGDSQGDTDNFHRKNSQIFAQNAGAQIARIGSQIAERNMNIQPTLKVKPGYAFNLFVHKTLELQPYQL